MKGITKTVQQTHAILAMQDAFTVLPQLLIVLSVDQAMFVTPVLALVLAQLLSILMSTLNAETVIQHAMLVMMVIRLHAQYATQGIIYMGMNV